MKKEQKTYRTTPKKIAIAKERAEHIKKLDSAASDFVKRFGEIIKEARGDMSIYNLALNSGISTTTISRVEVGKACSLESAAKLCKALNLDLKATGEDVVKETKAASASEERIEQLNDKINRFACLLQTHLDEHGMIRREAVRPEIFAPIMKELMKELWANPKYKEPIKGELAILWRNDKRKALCRFFDKKEGRFYFDTAGIPAENAILCESMEQYKAFVMDAADNFKLEV